MNDQPTNDKRFDDVARLVSVAPRCPRCGRGFERGEIAAADAIIDQHGNVVPTGVAYHRECAPTTREDDPQ